MLILPSRGRPTSLQEFFASSSPAEPGVVLLDVDDASHYATLTVPANWSVVTGSRAPYSELCNRALALYPDEPWYGCLGDDCRARPAGWDTHLAQLATAGHIAYGNDLINYESPGAFWFLPGSLVRKVGWICYPEIKHLYSDTVWYDIGRALGILRYCPDIITEHLHFSTGKMPYDQTARERPLDGDRAAYEEFRAKHFTKVVEQCAS